MSEVRCPACGAAEAVLDGGPASLDEIAVFRCEVCKLRVAYGAEPPVVVVEPTRGPHGIMWTRLRVQHPRTRAELYAFDVDLKLAEGLADGIRSLLAIAHTPKVNQ